MCCVHVARKICGRVDDKTFSSPLLTHVYWFRLFAILVVVLVPFAVGHLNLFIALSRERERKLFSPQASFKVLFIPHDDDIVSQPDGPIIIFSSQEEGKKEERPKKTLVLSFYKKL